MSGSFVPIKEIKDWCTNHVPDVSSWIELMDQFSNMTKNLRENNMTKSQSWEIDEY